MTTININNLTKSQLEDLEKQIAEAKNKLTTSYGRKRVEEGEKYYYIGFEWVCSTKDTYDQGDTEMYELGNYYLTQEEAEKARDRQLAIVRVNDAIDRLNEGWVADFIYGNNKCVIYYSYDNFCTNYNTMSNFGYILNYMKSEEVAEQIISEYKNDLKIIFNIK